MSDVQNAALSLEEAHRYWAEYTDPMIFRVVTFMESVEKWTLDGQADIEQAFSALSEALTDIKGVDLGNEEAFIQTAAYVHMSRALKLLQTLDMGRPGAASKLLIHAEEVSHSTEDTPGLFLRRNIVFERLRLLSRVFSKERLTLITKALEGGDYA
ncbi:MAG: intracellular multiplication protein IcmW [marine bacterium B5-7]|nr:MAG: intracellular multiplication protein IcmW [marine bacterium B5-7]